MSEKDSIFDHIWAREVGSRALHLCSTVVAFADSNPLCGVKMNSMISESPTDPKRHFVLCSDCLLIAREILEEKIKAIDAMNRNLDEMLELCTKGGKVGC